jgi:hypothetical protein
MNADESLFYNELISKFEFIRVQSYSKAQEYLSFIGSSLSDDVYIIDPYLNQPIHLESLILNANALVNVFILYDFDKSVISRSDIKERFTEFCTNNNLKCKISLKSTSESSKNPIHDRFILSKERGWMIGTSFNHLGNRQSYIIDIDNSTFINRLVSDFKPKYSKLFYMKQHFLEMWKSIDNLIECEAPNDIQF